VVIIWDFPDEEGASMNLLSGIEGGEIVKDAVV